MSKLNSKLDYSEIEKKWQKHWQENKINKTDNVFNDNKKKFYILDMFPYPSGEGLHVGHPKGYIATDVYSRMKKMQGYNVLHPMGWDAFGLPAEQFAIKNKINPNIATSKNVARYKEQIEMLGLNYDWDREINTTDPKYYKWTQWMWKQMYKDGLAFESFDPINWCPTCKTGLANEDLDGNTCERCGTIVEKKKLRQWTIRITDYADRLLADLDKLNWEPHIKELQRNWIGKSEGSEIEFEVLSPALSKGKGEIPNKLKIFTTRADTLFGCTFMAISYTLAKEWIENGWNASEEIKNFISKLEKEEKERTIDFDMSKLEKEGIDTGIKAINPANGEEVPIYIANYILSDYGTGAIMAVPAHDERDYEFAKKYNFEIKDVIAQSCGEELKDSKDVFGSTVTVYDLNKKLFLKLENKNKDNKPWLPSGGINGEESYEECAIRELKEEAGISKIDKVIKLGSPIISYYFNPNKNSNRRSLGFNYLVFTDSDQEINQDQESHENFEIKWVSYDELIKSLIEAKIGAHWVLALERAKNFIDNKKELFDDEGILINSGEFNGMNSEKARVKITEKVGGKMVSKYKLKDWVFARQRYWGEPFPIVFAEDKNGNRKSYAVADKDLPVILPNVENYEPTDNGESPLSNIKDWVEVYGFINNEGEFESISGAHSERELKTINTYKENFETYISETVQEVSGEWKEESDFIVEKLKGKKVLEIGSASGRDASYLKNEGVDIIASDIVDSFSKINIDKGLEFIKIDPLLDDFHNEKYDGVLSMASLLHSERYNFEKIITKINLALNDNGYLYLRLKNGEGELEEERKGGYRFFSFYNENELKNILEKFGFEIEKITYLENNKWINVLAKKNKNLEIKKFFRETNTMPQWAGSSWYYLRYIDPKNDEKFVNKELEKEWSPVDFYVGGAEHATRHLIYARFWHKFLFDKGLVNYDEPFSKLQTVGLIMAEDGKKMSKRYGNVVNPDDVIKEYGCDAMRTYEMFMGPFEKSIAWNTNSMAGVSRFLERVYSLAEKINLNEEVEDSKETERIINETIKKVGEDIEKFGFNTAIAQLMICLNTFEEEIKKGNSISKNTFTKFIQILSPFAVHISEEIYQNILENKISVHLSEWPEVDVSKIKKEEIEMSIQISGKMRGTFIIKPDSSDEEVEESVKSTEVYQKYITSEAQIKKIIIVKNRLINIVI